MQAGPPLKQVTIVDRGLDVRGRQRFFRSLKEQCVWLNRFANKDQAFVAIADWIDQYHERRPHSALGCLNPAWVPSNFTA